MITPGIDRHINPLGHVTTYALGTGRARWVVMVLAGIKPIGFMALGTERVTLCDQLTGMHVMTIVTGHPLSRHLTLQKRTQHKDFVFYLTIGKIEPRVKKCDAVLVVKGSLCFDIANR